MRSTDVVVVDHYDSYTWNLVHLIASVTGVVPTVVEHDRVSVDEVLRHAYVVLSPGPGHPDDPADFAVGREVLLAAERPVLGVCLGMQGLVSAYGGVVARERPAHGEVATIEHDGRGVFTGLPQDFAAVRYHSLQAIEIPDSLEVSAWCGSPNSTTSQAQLNGEGGPTQRRAVMGVRHRALPLEGVQFHPESILSEFGADLIRNFLEGA
ncbi:MAG: aminodeoxychorismate/anthranilate synthase component II [Nocardioides sp.]